MCLACLACSRCPLGASHRNTHAAQVDIHVPAVPDNFERLRSDYMVELHLKVMQHQLDQVTPGSPHFFHHLSACHCDDDMCRRFFYGMPPPSRMRPPPAWLLPRIGTMLG